MADTDTDREQGVDFTTIEPLLADLPYPVTAEQLVAEHGDVTIERTNAGPISLRELFEAMGEETFESGEEVRQGVLNVMPEEAVGREGYSDRGGSTPDENRGSDAGTEEESF